MFRKFSVLVLLFMILIPSQVYSASKKYKGNIDSQIAAEEKKRSELSKQIKKYKQQIKDMGAKVEGLLTKVNTLQLDESAARQ